MSKNDDTIQNENVTKETGEQELQEPEVIITDEPEVSEWENNYKRALADYQNLEKRVAAQRRELILSASRSILERVLPVLDTLMLASAHTDEQGLKVSIQQFLDVLKAEGVTRIEVKGKKFDPSIMEAVGTGAGDEGKVIEEARAGYMLHEALLRPAQVIVGAKG